MSEAIQPNPTPTMATFGIPMVYCNGFNAGLSATEIGCILMYDNQPAMRMVMPLATAKSLVKVLETLVGKYEQATKTKILTVEELAPLLSTLS